VAIERHRLARLRRTPTIFPGTGLIRTSIKRPENVVFIEVIAAVLADDDEDVLHPNHVIAVGVGVEMGLA
jgi:hypothetical protein